MTKLLIRSLFLLSLLGWSQDLAGCQPTPTPTFTDLTVESQECQDTSIHALLSERSSSPRHHASSLPTIAETTEAAGKNQLLSPKKKVERIGGPSWFYDGATPGYTFVYYDVPEGDFYVTSDTGRFLRLRVLLI